MSDLKYVAQLALKALLRSDARLYDVGLEAIAALKEAIKNQGEPVGVYEGLESVCIFAGREPEVGTKLYTSAPTIPEGWQLVPIEPTPEMIEAGNDEFRNPDSRRHTVSSCYKAMLSAAHKGEKE